MQNVNFTCKFTFVIEWKEYFRKQLKYAKKIFGLIVTNFTKIHYVIIFTQTTN